MVRVSRWLAAGVVAGLFGAALAVTLPSATAFADETTASVDTMRTGWDSNEANLSPSSVAASDFGQLFSTPVDGQVYAQPIVAGGNLIAVTDNNNIYGLDRVTGAQKWTRNLGPAWPAATLSCGDLTPNIGVTSTPVYDPATGSVFLTSKVNNGPDAAHPTWYLHAVDPATGAERAGFPTVIQGAPTNNPTVPFNPETAMQRPGLLLLNGVVYLGFGSHCDATPYVGYVVGVNTSTGRLSTMWSTEANASDEAGIWQSGGGLVSDGPGRIIVVTGNGVAPAPGPGDTPPATLGESVVRLAVNADGSLAAQSFFSPHDNTKLNADDADLGSGGAMALPASFGTASHPHLIVTIGKSGALYLLDADHLGGAGQGVNGGDASVASVGPFNGVWGHPAFWGGDGGYVYDVENAGPLRALQDSAQNGNPTLTSVGTTTDTFGYTSGSPVVTSSGTTSGSALVWVVYAAGPGGTSGQIRAYDAVPQNGVMNLRYSAPIGTAAKFAIPATDGGKVYVGTRDGHILGFGRPTTSVLVTKPYDFGSAAVASTANATVTVTANRNLTLTGISAPAPFGTPALSASVPLTTGQTYSVPVSYTPTTWGSATGSLTFTTDQGTTALDLHGNGTQPGLGANPPNLAFGQVSTGAAKQLGVNIVNTGTAPETITGATAPSAPFTVTNLPTGGTTLAPGASQVVSVTYTPTNGSATGNADSSQLVVTGDAGSVTVPLTGTALTGQPLLTLTPTALNFGIVPVGQTVSQTFTVGNTGTVPLTITKAKAPTGVFNAPTQLAEGQTIAPGDKISVTVTFTPATAYPATATYEVTGNDGQAAQLVNLSGNVDPIGTYYQQLGGSRGSYLSDPVSAEYNTANGGMEQDYRGGSILWSPASGAHAIRGAILAHYQQLNGPAGVLGYPTTDELTSTDTVGRYNRFTGPDPLGAAIYWTPNTGAHEVHGAIYAEWQAIGSEVGRAAYPTTDETVTPDGVGRYNHFSALDNSGASIYWSPASGAHEVQGAIRADWAANGWERGPAGYPTTDETVTPDGIGRYNHFTGQNPSHASIYWSPATGAHEVHGAIRDQWAALGWERSRLGYPTSDEFAISGGRQNNFAHGWISWLAGSGTHVGYR